MKVVVSTELHTLPEKAYVDFKDCHKLMREMGMVNTYPPEMHTVELHSGQKVYKYVVEMRW
jgi:hypothetical protein